MNVSNAAMNWAADHAMKLPPNQRPPKPKGIALIICILPFPATEIRRAVKHFGDVETGIPTQCIVSLRATYPPMVADVPRASGQDFGRPP